MKIPVTLHAMVAGNVDYSARRATDDTYLGITDGPGIVGAIVEVTDRYNRPVSPGDTFEVVSVDESAWK